MRQIVEAGAEGDSVRLTTGLIQFVAAHDVAGAVAERAIGAPVDGRVELGGPEALGMDAWARRLLDHVPKSIFPTRAPSPGVISPPCSSMP